MPAARPVERPLGRHRRPGPGRHRAEPAGGGSPASWASGARRRQQLSKPLAWVATLAAVGAVAAASSATGPDHTVSALRAVDPAAAPTHLLGPDPTTRTEGSRRLSDWELWLARTAGDRADALLRVSRDGDRDRLDRGGRSEPDLDRLERRAQLRADRRVGALRQLSEATQARAEELQSDQWVLPLAQYALSARFGEAGYLWSSGSHPGLDFSASEGTPVVAVAGGVVTTAGYSAEASWAGNLVVVKLEDGKRVWYAHQSSVAVAVGDSVQPGQMLGWVGSTGNSTGPHLHLEVQVDGRPIDPAGVLRRHDVAP